jgi:hypothetical protein
MTSGQIRYQNASNGLVILTGVALYWAKHQSGAQDPYSNVSGSGELLAHNSHILVAPLLVFSAGLLWKNHIWPKFLHLSLPRMGVIKGLSGLVMLATLIPMVASGSLIQITVDDYWRKIAIQTHVLSSLVWTVATVFHWVKRKKLKT